MIDIDKAWPLIGMGAGGKGAGRRKKQTPKPSPAQIQRGQDLKDAGRLAAEKRRIVAAGEPLVSRPKHAAPRAGGNSEASYRRSPAAPVNDKRFSSSSAKPAPAKPKTWTAAEAVGKPASAPPKAAEAAAAPAKVARFKTKTKVGAGILAATGATAGTVTYLHNKKKRQEEDGVYGLKAASLVNPFEEVVVFGKAYPVAEPVPSSERLSALVPTGAHVSHTNKLVHIKGPGARPRRQELQRFSGPKSGGQHGLTSIHKGVPVGVLRQGPKQTKLIEGTRKATGYLAGKANNAASSPELTAAGQWAGKHKKGLWGTGAVGVLGTGLAVNSKMPTGNSRGDRMY